MGWSSLSLLLLPQWFIFFLKKSWCIHNHFYQSSFFLQCSHQVDYMSCHSNFIRFILCDSEVFVRILSSEISRQIISFHSTIERPSFSGVGSRKAEKLQIFCNLVGYSNRVIFHVCWIHPLCLCYSLENSQAK